MKITHILNQTMRLFLILIAIYLIVKKDYLFAIAAVIASLLSFLPAIVKKNYKISLPFIINFMITSVLFLHILSVFFGWFDSIPNWSYGMHFLGTATIAILAFMTIYTLDYTKKIKLNIGMMVFFTIIFSIAIGATWEVGEFFTDKLLGTNSQGDTAPTPLDDTMWDLVWDFVAGVIVGISGGYFTKRFPKDLEGVARSIIKTKK